MSSGGGGGEVEGNKTSASATSIVSQEAKRAPGSLKLDELSIYFPKAVCVTVCVCVCCLKQQH